MCEDSVIKGKFYNVDKTEKILSSRSYYEKFVDINVTKEACSTCPNFNNNWGCPEFDADNYNCWREYDNIKIRLLKISFKKNILDNTFSKDEIKEIVAKSLLKEKNIDRKFLLREEKAFNGLSLSAGFCDICDDCNRQTDEACRFPELVRFSLESVGALVGKTTKELFGLDMKWIDMDNGKMPEYLTIVTGLLY